MENKCVLFCHCTIVGSRGVGLGTQDNSTKLWVKLARSAEIYFTKMRCFQQVKSNALCIDVDNMTFKNNLPQSEARLITSHNLHTQLTTSCDSSLEICCNGMFMK